eukprot:COSAG02_NODE_579_length_20073_cov_2118.572745_15_plen_820_part_00
MEADDSAVWGIEEGEPVDPPPPPPPLGEPVDPPPPPPPGSLAGLQLSLPMTLPTRTDPTPTPKDAYVWVPAILARVGLLTQQDPELAARTGMTMRWNEQHALEFNLTDVHGVQGQYLCRYVQAVSRRLGLRGVKLTGWNAMARNLRDPKDWTVAGAPNGTLHNVRLFREPQRGGRPLSSGGVCYQERQWADPAYYQPWDGKGSRPAPTEQVVERVRGVEKTKDVDSGQGGLPGATMELANLLGHQLECGCTWQGVAIPPNPRVFEDARRDAEFLDTDDAMTIAQDLWKPANVPKLGSVEAVPEAYREAVADLARAGHQLVKSGKFAEAADKYQEAHTIHTSSQTLGSWIQRAQQAAASMDIVEAQLNAHGREISWDQFVDFWMASAGRSTPVRTSGQPMQDDDEDRTDPLSDPPWMDPPMPELSSAELAGLPMLLEDTEEDQCQNGSDTGAPRAAAAAPVTPSLPPPAVISLGQGQGQEQEQEVDLMQTISNSMERVSIDHPSPNSPPVVEWVVDIDQGWARGWKECVLEIATTTATMTLREKSAGVCSGPVIAQKHLPGCRVVELRNPRNRHGTCSRDRSARKIEFEDGDSYKLVAVSCGNDPLWYPQRIHELFEQIERLAQWVPPLLGGRRSRGSRGSDYMRPVTGLPGVGTDRRRESNGRAASPPPRRVSFDELQRCRSDRSDRSDSSAGGVQPPPLPCSGWLWKAGQYNTSFKKRFCRLEYDRDRRVLKYYEREPCEGVVAKGQIDLDKAAAESSQPILTVDADPQQFKLRAEGRDYHFKWDDECGGSAQAWMQGLLSAMRRASQRLSDSFRESA